jgi:hypothetical protein
MTTAERDAKAVASGNYMEHSQRWLGPNTDRRAYKPLSNECLAALREAAASARRPLTDAERTAITAKFQ